MFVVADVQIGVDQDDSPFSRPLPPSAVSLSIQKVWLILSFPALIAPLHLRSATTTAVDEAREGALKGR